MLASLLSVSAVLLVVVVVVVVVVRFVHAFSVVRLRVFRPKLLSAAVICNG